MLSSWETVLSWHVCLVSLSIMKSANAKQSYCSEIKPFEQKQLRRNNSAEKCGICRDGACMYRYHDLAIRNMSFRVITGKQLGREKKILPWDAWWNFWWGNEFMFLMRKWIYVSPLILQTCNDAREVTLFSHLSANGNCTAVTCRGYVSGRKPLLRQIRCGNCCLGWKNVVVWSKVGGNNLFLSIVALLLWVYMWWKLCYIYTTWKIGM